MQISGKGKISNKWVDGQIDRNQFDFTIDEKGRAKGSFQWSDVKKGKNGSKDEFTTTVKRFTCFDEKVIKALESSLGNNIEIVGKLAGYTYPDKQGVKKKSEQITINEVAMAAKSDYKKAVKEEDDDSMIPF